MKIKRFFKTILMIDFVTGLLIAIKESFRQKKTIKTDKRNTDSEIRVKTKEKQTQTKENKKKPRET